MFAAILILASSLAAQPRVETFPAPKGHIPTEIARHGDVMTFVSWTNWPALEPHLGRVTARGRIETEALEKEHMPGVFATAADGSLWITDGKQSVLWRVDEKGNAEQVDVPLPTLGIAISADGTIWCTHPDATNITRYSTEGVIQASSEAGRKRHKVKRAAPSRAPAGMSPAWAKAAQVQNRRDVRPTWLTVDTSGNAWFSEPAGRAVGVVTPDDQLRRFKLPPEWGAPGRLVLAPDGQIWFVVTKAPVLAQVSADGFFSSVDIPAVAGTIAVDSKGRVWFSAGNDLGYVDGEGAVHAVALPPGDRLIRSMAEGPDGAMWFADQKGKTIGRVTLD